MGKKQKKPRNDLEQIINELSESADQSGKTRGESSSEFFTPLGTMSIREALESENPLDQLFCELGGVTEEQRIFKRIYEALLAVNSGGLAMLWDHFSFEEVTLLLGSLETIGAGKTRDAVARAHDFLKEKLGIGINEDTLMELLCSDSFETEMEPTDLELEELILEMEEALLAYAKSHVGELESMP